MSKLRALRRDAYPEWLATEDVCSLLMAAEQHVAVLIARSRGVVSYELKPISDLVSDVRSDLEVLDAEFAPAILARRRWLLVRDADAPNTADSFSAHSFTPKETHRTLFGADIPVERPS